MTLPFFHRSRRTPDPRRVFKRFLRIIEKRLAEGV
jgi:hypothetical protein